MILKMNNTIEILRAGIYSTIQDMKRVGFKKYGIPKSGPMDEYSHIIANWLVSKDIYSETIEFTHIGPKIKFNFNTIIGIYGSFCKVLLNKKNIGIGKSYRIKKGDVLDIGQCIDGIRGYLSISGEMDIKNEFNSISTYDKIQIGGVNGRKLLRNDSINFINCSSSLPLNEVPESFKKRYNNSKIIRIIKGIHFNFFDNKSLENNFSILPESDRMAIRLNGEIKMKKDKEISSIVVSKGTIQVPRDGKPIILMSDAQSTGGYPIVGNICSVDVPILAQLKTSCKLNFKIICLEESEKLIEFEKRKFFSKLNIKL